jgi:hypothetical protein
MSTLGQLIVCLLLRSFCRDTAIGTSTSHNDHEHKHDTNSVWTGPSLVYWLCPVSVLAAALSPLPALSHALFLGTIALATGRSRAPLLALLGSGSLLLALHPETLPLLWLLFILSISSNSFPTTRLTSAPSATAATSVASTTTSTAAVGVGVSVHCLFSRLLRAGGAVLLLSAAAAAWSLSRWPALALLDRGEQDRQEYFPGFGVMW